MRFIYVFSEADRDYLISRGYTLLKQHSSTPIWVFLNGCECFDESKLSSHVLSNTLTF